MLLIINMLSGKSHTLTSEKGTNEIWLEHKVKKEKYYQKSK